MYQNKFRDNEEYKAKIDAHRPLSLNAIKQIRDYFKISFTYSSNAIEGNTLSLSETKVVIEDAFGGSGVLSLYEVEQRINTIGAIQNIENYFVITCFFRYWQ